MNASVAGRTRGAVTLLLAAALVAATLAATSSPALGQTATPCKDESLPYDEAKSNNEGVETPFLGILDVRLLDEESVEFDWCVHLPVGHGTLYEPNFTTAAFGLGGYQDNGGWIGSAPTVVTPVIVELGETVYGSTTLTNSGEIDYLNLSVITEGEFIELAIRAVYDHVKDSEGNRLDANPIEVVDPPAIVIVHYDFADDQVVDPPPDPSDPGDPPPDPGDPTPTCYFPDVTTANTHSANILAICIRQITQGYSDGTYGPADLVTRAQMASFIARALGLAPEAANQFGDVSGTHAGNINAIAKAGVTLGCNADGTLYCPDEFVTRAQMGSFLARAFALTGSGGNAFADVVAGSTHAGNIDALRVAGVTLGCDANGTIYCPDDLVRRDQMASFIERALVYAGL